MQNFEDFLKRVYHLTFKDLDNGGTLDDLFRHTVEEVGEVSAAMTVEMGQKNKKLKETATEECVDLVICALALFYAHGGTGAELVTIGNKKLDKWQNNYKPANGNINQAITWIISPEGQEAMKRLGDMTTRFSTHLKKIKSVEGKKMDYL